MLSYILITRFPGETDVIPLCKSVSPLMTHMQDLITSQNTTEYVKCKIVTFSTLSAPDIQNGKTLLLVQLTINGKVTLPLCQECIIYPQIHIFQSGQIYLAIWRNPFGNLEKYILQTHLLVQLTTHAL